MAEQKRALYEARRTGLREQLEALRAAHEVFSAAHEVFSAEPGSSEFPGTEVAATEVPGTEAPGTEVALGEGDCGFVHDGWTPDDSVTQGRWNGLWDQYGDDGIGDLTLTQSGHCVFGTYDYQGWSLWLKLMVTGEQQLLGYWFSDDANHPVTCEEPRDGVRHWGQVHMRFDDTFTRFQGDSSGCDGVAAGILDSGERVR